MKDLMIDLETLGSSNDAVIVQIGACYFDRHTAEIGNTFKQNIDINSCLREGFAVDGDTIKWWMTEQINQVTFYGDTVLIKPAIASFIEFSNKADKVWSHATFDFCIMMEYIHRFGMKPKFHYRSARDIRTLIDMAEMWDDVYKNKDTRTGWHDALEDCKYQVEYCVKAMQKINAGIHKNVG